MKIKKLLFISFSFFMISQSAFPQDNRTTETKVADLLARLPSNDQLLTDKLMVDMLSLGEYGLKLICNQVVPSGTVEDTLHRFAIGCFSRFLSMKNEENEIAMWEEICINYATVQKDPDV